jgi:hypothetical protein
MEGALYVRNKDGKKRFKLAWISGEGYVPGTFLYLCHPRKII